MSPRKPLKLAIMQPYFLPYLGYWQLMNYVENFVVYDDIQFTKKGWIHRNRYLGNNRDQIFTLPLKKGSDFLDIRDRELADSWAVEKEKIRRKIEGAYKNAPYFDDGMSILNDCLESNATNLFCFVLDAIIAVKSVLDITTKIVVSSSIGDTSSFRSKDRVINICKRLNASDYVNPIGGVDLYSKEEFSKSDLTLHFHRSKDIEYSQLTSEFFPNLSIVDVVMFNGIDRTKYLLSKFEIL